MQLKLLIYINGFKLKIDDTLNSKTRIRKKNDIQICHKTRTKTYVLNSQIF